MNELTKFNLHPIEVARGLITNPIKLAKDLARQRLKVAIITDETIAALYGDAFLSSLKISDLDVQLLTFPAGECFKTRATKEALENQLFEKGFGRDSCIIAMGGGVVSDLAGFVAATYCRGIPFVIIPTTLLGMVDACMGGKTGVNVPYGKNLIGAMYQPGQVLIDPNVLVTLPLTELKNGIVEMIKHGLIADASYFAYLEQNVDELLSLNLNVVDVAIAGSINIKMNIVEQDANEIGIRRLLNFGHTVGHALEKQCAFEIPHGEAVAIGMAVESYLSMKLGYLDSSSFSRIIALLKRCGLSLHLTAVISSNSIMDAMKLDKKSLDGRPRFVLLNQIGNPHPFDRSFCSDINDHTLLEALNWMNHDLCRY